MPRLEPFPDLHFLLLKEALAKGFFFFCSLGAGFFYGPCSAARVLGPLGSRLEGLRAVARSSTEKIRMTCLFRGYHEGV